jgi:uncharacterized protein YpmB
MFTCYNELVDSFIMPTIPTTWDRGGIINGKFIVHSEVRKMKKWIIIFFAAIMLITTGIVIKVYFQAFAPVKSAEKKAVALADKKAHLSSVTDFHLYNGNETVYVIEGKNQKGAKVIVWIPAKTKQVIVKKAGSGLSREQAIQKLEETKNPKKIISVRLGMEKMIPFWEIYYLSDNNLINYYYIHFQTGEWLKKIENL